MQEETANGGSPELHATVRSAILVASQCQIYLKSNGEESRGCGLSTALFLQGRPNVPIEDFHKKLESIIQVAGLRYVELQACMTVQNRISLNLDFYNKLCKIWDSFGVKDKSLSVACAQTIKKVAWLVFIIARIKVLDSSRSR